MWEGVNDLPNLLLRDYLAGPIRKNSVGIKLWGTSLQIDIIKGELNKVRGKKQMIDIS